MVGASRQSPSESGDRNWSPGQSPQQPELNEGSRVFPKRSCIQRVARRRTSPSCCGEVSMQHQETESSSAGDTPGFSVTRFLGVTRTDPIRMCRKRPFAIGGPGRRPARAAVCRIPCLILCLADVARTSMARRPVLTRRPSSLRRDAFKTPRPGPKDRVLHNTRCAQRSCSRGHLTQRDTSYGQATPDLGGNGGPPLVRRQPGCRPRSSSRPARTSPPDRRDTATPRGYSARRPGPNRRGAGS